MIVTFDPAGTRNPSCSAVPLVPFGETALIDLETRDALGQPVLVAVPPDGVVSVTLADSPDEDAAAVQAGVCLSVEKGLVKLAVPALSDTLWKYVAGGPRPAWLHIGAADPFVVAVDASGEVNSDPVQVHSTMVTALGDAAVACASAQARVASLADGASAAEERAAAHAADAEASEHTAQTAAASSGASAAGAAESARQAGASAAEAAGSRQAAEGHADSARTSAADSQASAVTATGAADRASASALSAISHAAIASESASVATEQAVRAEAAAQAAATSAAESAVADAESRLSGMVSSAESSAARAESALDSVSARVAEGISSVAQAGTSAIAEVNAAGSVSLAAMEAVVTATREELAGTLEAGRESIADDVAAAAETVGELVTEAEGLADGVRAHAESAASSAATAANSASSALGSASSAGQSAEAATEMSVRAETAKADAVLAEQGARRYAELAEQSSQSALSVLRKVSCEPCTNLAIVRGEGYVLLQWGDPADRDWGLSRIVSWQRTELWAMPGVYPDYPGQDGAVLLASTVRHESRDRYLSEWVRHDCGDTVWGYRLFSYCDNGVVTDWEADLYPMVDAIYTLPMMHRMSQAGTLLDFVPIGSTFHIRNTVASAEGVTVGDEHLVKLMDYDACVAADPDRFPHVATIQWVDCLDIGTLVFEPAGKEYVHIPGEYLGEFAYYVNFTRVTEGTDWNEGDDLTGKKWYTADADWVFSGADGTAVAGTVYWKAGGYTKLTVGTDYQVGEPIRSTSVLTRRRSNMSTSNHVSESALLQWLNAEGWNWFSPSTPWSGTPPYATRQGFLSGFTDADRACLIPTRRAFDISDPYGGGIGRYTAKVYLPTRMEVFGDMNRTSEESRHWVTYSGAASRCKLVNGSGVTWWLASPNVGYGSFVWHVTASGTAVSGHANNACGVAPALSI